VLKYDGRPLRQLARHPDQWTSPEQFDPTGKLQERLLSTFDRAMAGDDLFGKLASRIDDPNWNGLLVLDARLPLAGIPDAMKAIGAGLPPALEVPYLGLDVSGIDPDLPEKEPWRSALFGLVHHPGRDEPDPAWEGDSESRVTMRVPRLILRVETVINQPGEFKVFRTRQHRDGTTSSGWFPMCKWVGNLHHYQSHDLSCNRRYLEALAAVDDPAPVGLLDESGHGDRVAFGVQVAPAEPVVGVRHAADLGGGPVVEVPDAGLEPCGLTDDGAERCGERQVLTAPADEPGVEAACGAVGVGGGGFF
ncbi:MAG TPA: hypothetical protein PK530_02775, partial [Anaerolineales bacterium]|nr:hypothetical protein [Anaerolineales bacterium]